MTRTEADLDQMHENVIARFPGGVTPKQFYLVTLESADDDGRVYPHSILDVFKQHSLLLGMMMDGLIVNRGRGYNSPYEWHITDQGRAWLEMETRKGNEISPDTEARRD
jgi:hypothetical protein